MRAFVLNGMNKGWIYLLIVFVLASCTRPGPYRLSIAWKDSPQPQAPDYTQMQAWAAHPQKQDPADQVPKGSDLKEAQSQASVDVFFIHPTIFTKAPQNQYQWNADWQDADMNQKVDQSTILNQASIFNASARVYAPRYRQAHYYSFLTPQPEDKKAALDLAYADVKAAFLHYLAKENQGRPFLIAGHSQGTIHATRLLQELLDEKSLQKQLVAAYLVGIPTKQHPFRSIPVCAQAEATGCYVAWTTYAQGYYPEWHPQKETELVSVNPISWTLDSSFHSHKQNAGGVAYGFRFKAHLADAKNQYGLLWTHTPFVLGRAFVKVKNWHAADYNLYYLPIRQNVGLRVKKYLEKYGKSSQ